MTEHRARRLFFYHDCFDSSDIRRIIDGGNRPPQRFSPLSERGLDDPIEVADRSVDLNFYFDGFDRHLTNYELLTKNCLSIAIANKIRQKSKYY